MNIPREKDREVDQFMVDGYAKNTGNLCQKLRVRGITYRKFKSEGHNPGASRFSTEELFGERIKSLLFDSERPDKIFEHLDGLFKVANPKPTPGMKASFTGILRATKVI